MDVRCSSVPAAKWSPRWRCCSCALVAIALPSGHGTFPALHSILDTGVFLLGADDRLPVLGSGMAHRSVAGATSTPCASRSSACSNCCTCSRRWSRPPPAKSVAVLAAPRNLVAARRIVLPIGLLLVRWCSPRPAGERAAVRSGHGGAWRVALMVLFSVVSRYSRAVIVRHHRGPPRRWRRCCGSWVAVASLAAARRRPARAHLRGVRAASHCSAAAADAVFGGAGGQVRHHRALRCASPASLFLLIEPHADGHRGYRAAHARWSRNCKVEQRGARSARGRAHRRARSQQHGPAPRERACAQAAEAAHAACSSSASSCCAGSRMPSPSARISHSIFQVVVRSLEEHLPADFAAMCDYEHHRRLLTGEPRRRRAAKPLALSLAMTENSRIEIDRERPVALRRGQARATNPTSPTSAFRFRSGWRARGLRSMVIVPLMVEQRSGVFGVLVVARRTPMPSAAASANSCASSAITCRWPPTRRSCTNRCSSAYDDLQRSQHAVLRAGTAARARPDGERHRARHQQRHLAGVAVRGSPPHARDRLQRARAQAARQSSSAPVDDVAHTVARMGEFYRQRPARSSSWRPWP